jgi:hypothetical protein
MSALLTVDDLCDVDISSMETKLDPPANAFYCEKESPINGKFIITKKYNYPQFYVVSNEKLNLHAVELYKDEIYKLFVSSCVPDIESRFLPDEETETTTHNCAICTIS